MASNSKFIAELLDSNGDVIVSNLDNLGTAATNDTGDFLQVSNNLSDLNNAATARTSLGLGTAATTNSTAYATAAQGTKADSALQPANIGSTVQAYDADLTALGNLSKTDGNFIVGNGTTWVTENAATARSSLGLGTAATTNSTAYATAAQGTKADSALQPANNLSDLNNAATARTNLGLGLVATLDVAGGAQDFVATGTIATGDVVGLRSDGTVEVIPAHSSSVDVTNLNFSTQNVYDYVYHKVLERFIIFYRGYDSAYYYYYTIGKVVNNTISFSSPVDLMSNSSIGNYGITAIHNLKAEVEYYRNTIIVTGNFTKDGNYSCGVLIAEIDTVNEVLTGSFDTSAYGYTEIVASNVSDIKPVVLSGHSNVNFGDYYRFSMLYRNPSNGYLSHRAATVNTGSGTQLVTLGGSTTTIVSNNVSNFDGVHHQNNDKLFVFYTYNSSSDKNVYSNAGTITYTGALTTTFSSQVTAFTNPYSNFTSNSNPLFLGRPIYDTTQSKTLLLIDLYNSSTYITYRYDIVSNYTTNVNILSSNLISTDYVNNNSSIRYKMLHFSSTTGEFMFGMNSKTTISISNQDNNAYITVFFGKIINNNFVITKTYKDYTPSTFLTGGTYFHATDDYGYILLQLGDVVAGQNRLSFCSHTNNIDKLMNIVGISNENITDGNIGSIAISGGYNTELTGLVAGNKYYLQGDGTIGLNSLSKNLLGTAVSSTKLFLQQNIK